MLNSMLFFQIAMREHESKCNQAIPLISDPNIFEGMPNRPYSIFVTDCKFSS